MAWLEHLADQEQHRRIAVKLPLIPPVRAWLTWQVTPGTFGSWKASTHTLWLAPTSFQAVVTQPTVVSAKAGAAGSTSRSAPRRVGRSWGMEDILSAGAGGRPRDA